MKMGKTQKIISFVPDYAVPLLAMDQVVRQDPDGITTRKAISGNEPYFQGHYPGYPIYPGVFIIEAVHQASKYLAAVYFEPVRLFELRSTRFLAPVLPGDMLECQCRSSESADRKMLHVDAICRSGDRVVAEIKLTYVLEPEK